MPGATQGEKPCDGCGTANPAHARFCMGCGAALARRCGACGAEAPEQARFCMSCGQALEEGVVAAETPVAAPREQLPEERRQVTVLFADLSGYTAVAERMDPEAVKGLVDRALRRLGLEVESYGGTVDKYIGDNVMALFGAPVAHEDDAERAVRAGLGMLSAMDDINASLPKGVDFALRVGINTGEVMAGAVGGDEYTVTGDTVNVASRLQAAARPGSVTVGERTARATEQVISYRELEPLTLKGKAEPVPAWEALSAVGSGGVRRELTTRGEIVGRDAELHTLEALYAKTTSDGRPRLATVLGEAGVGKSRLLAEFASRVTKADPPAVVREGRCLPYGSGIIFWALAEMVRGEAGIVDADSSEQAWRKLLARIEEVIPAEPSRAETTPERLAAQIARPLGLEGPEDAVVATDTDPERSRDALLSALRSMIEGAALNRPLVLAFEDIHWADDGMLDVIEHLVQWVRAPLFVLCLARDDLLERRPGWGASKRNTTQIFLEPLTAGHSRALVESLLTEETGLPVHDLAPLVAERSGGNPLFAEEMVRRLLEEGSDVAAELPDTVQAVLAARLDSLSRFERRVVQQAAVVGRTFWEGALEPVVSQEGGDLDRALASLQEKDILIPVDGSGSGLAGERELAFKHVLIRDVAYAMLPKTVRAHKHFEVGRFIEERAGDRTDELVPLLAEHFGRAAALGRESGLDAIELREITARAVSFLEEAGDAAASLFANPQALSHYKHALGVLGDTDQAAAVRIGEKQGDVALRLGRVDGALEVWGECIDYHRGQEDLDRVADLHRKLGAALAVKGERKAAIENYQRGINLLKDGPPRLELVRLYEEAAWLYLQTGDNMLAIYASEKALRLAERLGEDRAASRAHGIFGRVFGRIGDTEKARQNLERSVELARGSDHGETILALLALGRHLEVSEADTGGAQEAYDEALAIAEQVGDLPGQVELHSALAQLAAYHADWERVEISTQASLDLAEREGLTSKLCLPYALQGLLLWRDGDLEAAEGRFRKALELADQVGWSELAFQSLYGLSMTLRDRGDHIGAVGALDQAIDVCERAGLLAQSIQASAARAVALKLGGRDEAAEEAAAEARRLGDQLHYPVGRAASLEAAGVIASDPAEGSNILADAEAAWRDLDRPLEAARCRLLAGFVLREHDPAKARELLDETAERCEALGVKHLAVRARTLV